MLDLKLKMKKKSTESASNLHYPRRKQKLYHLAINAHNFMSTNFGIKNTQYLTAFTQGLKNGIQFLLNILKPKIVFFSKLQLTILRCKL